MKKYLVFRYYENRDYLYSVVRAINLQQAAEQLADNLTLNELQDEGIYTVTAIGHFEYKDSRVVLPEGAEIFQVVLPPETAHLFTYINER